MFSPSDYNDAVPQFTNGNYANTPLNPLYVEEPDAVNYNRGVEPLQTLPAQWWNWLCNKITSKLNKLNIYVKNIFDELAQLLSLVGITPDATEEEITTSQLKGMFQNGYPSFLSDNFKFESVLQERTRGVMVPPTDTWDSATHTLSLSGGFGILDTYKKVAFATSELVLPNDSAQHYIVSDANGDITIEDSIAESVILIGLCYDDEYLLCNDFVLNQGVDTIKLHKWYGESKITSVLATLLQTYYNSTNSTIETSIIINNVTNTAPRGIDGGIFQNCTITINSITNSNYGIYSGTFEKCNITLGSLTGSYGISGGTLKNCTITINSITSGGYGVHDGTFENCTISLGVISSNRGINGGTLKNCTITINSITSGGYGVHDGTFENCTITINSISTGTGINGGTLKNCTITLDVIKSSGYGIDGGTFENCTITINTLTSSIGIFSGTYYFVYAKVPTAPSASRVSGKGFVANDTTIKSL